MTEKQKHSLLCDFFMFFRENGERLRLAGYSIEGLVSCYLSAIAPTESKCTIDSIIQAFTSDNVTIDDILGPSRQEDIVLARQCAIYTIRSITGITQKKIGELFNRDHSTVHSSISRIQERLDSNQKYFDRHKQIIIEIHQKYEITME